MYWRSRMIVNDKLKKVWNAADVVYFKVRLKRLYRGTFEIHENIMTLPGIEIRRRDVQYSVINSRRDRLD
jgi:hypothetical protein